jgi:hypothetical protein
MNDDIASKTCYDPSSLLLDTFVIVGKSRLSAKDAEEALRSGSIRLGFADGETSYLETGGLRIAEGTLRFEGDAARFEVTAVYSGRGEMQ